MQIAVAPELGVFDARGDAYLLLMNLSEPVPADVPVRLSPAAVAIAHRALTGARPD